MKAFWHDTGWVQGGGETEDSELLSLGDEQYMVTWTRNYEERLDSAGGLAWV